MSIFNISKALTFNDFLNESLNDGISVLFYNGRLVESNIGTTKKLAGFYAKVASFLNVGKNYTVDLKFITDSKGREWKFDAIIVKGSPVPNDISNTKYAPENVWEGPSIEKLGTDEGSWFFTELSKAAFIVDGTEVILDKVNK